jgi:glycerophosphoryl diester phosphodiesterase
MHHPFFTSPRPLVFAHRGGSGLAPENTIEAFDNACTLGTDGLELDIHLSRDGVVVVHHDSTVDRTTNGRGEVVACTADELSRLDAGYRFTPDTADPVRSTRLTHPARPAELVRPAHPYRGRGIAVPTLATVLTRYRELRIIVEMKMNRPELAAAAVEVVRRADAVDRVCFGSFGLRVLRAARAMEPAIATSASREEVRWALYRSWCRWPVHRPSYDGYQAPEWSGHTRVVSRHFVEMAHRANLGVQVWTVDAEDDARRLLDWGVDALITDRPDVLIPVVREGR